MKTTEERLWAKVDRSASGCWEWTGKSRSAFGYGLIRLSKAEGGKLIGAHRLAWELTNGPIPEGLCVLHSCDNPPCCRPDHLHLGTKADNMREKVERGRAVTWKNGKWKACSKGHVDWYEPPRGNRYCRTCAKVASARFRETHPHYYRDWSRARRAKTEG